MKSNVEIIKSNYEEHTKLFENLAPQFEWHEMEGFPYGGIYRTPQELTAGVFRHIENDWDGFEAIAEEFLTSGDQVVTLGHYRATSKKTGKSMKAIFAHVYTLRDGSIVKFRQFADSATFAQAMH